MNTWRNGHDGSLLYINQSDEAKGTMILTISAPRKYFERSFLVEHFEEGDPEELVVHAIAVEPPAGQNATALELMCICAIIMEGPDFGNLMGERMMTSIVDFMLDRDREIQKEALKAISHLIKSAAIQDPRVAGDYCAEKGRKLKNKGTYGDNLTLSDMDVGSSMDVLVLDEMVNFEPTHVHGSALYDYLVANFLEDLGAEGRQNLKRIIDRSAGGNNRHADYVKHLDQNMKIHRENEVKAKKDYILAKDTRSGVVSLVSKEDLAVTQEASAEMTAAIYKRKQLTGPLPMEKE